MIENLSDMVLASAGHFGKTTAIRHNGDSLSYSGLASRTRQFGGALSKLGLQRNDRVGILTGKCFEYAVSIFGTAAAGGVFVPINTLLKARQIEYILNDCEVSILVTTKARWASIKDSCDNCPALHTVILTDEQQPESSGSAPALISWPDLMASGSTDIPARPIATDMAAIMYTSGSTGRPKGVVLSHANIYLGAASVAEYIGNDPDDIILAVLPFSFDAGLSQLTTGIHSGSCVVLHDFFLPGDVVKLVEKEGVTGITGVPPLWIQLAEQKWPEDAPSSLRYFANTGGKMPGATLQSLRSIFPKAQPFLMYGLTEAFRSTYLPPSEVDRRPDSIGKAIPNVEVQVVAEDGSLCAPGAIGELVHRGPLVSMGYWNDTERTATRFRPAPSQPAEVPLKEIAVWSGDFVKTDEEGFLYFVGRKDDMIKTSGYRVSPAEVEEEAYGSRLVSEVAALGLPDAKLGQTIVIIAKPSKPGSAPTSELLSYLRRQLPTYMVPAEIRWQDNLPRNANGKLDRPRMLRELIDGNEAPR